jgi:putative addiction module killer protein
MNNIKIFIYVSKNGKEPFSNWLAKLDLKTRAIVRTKLNRIKLGNFGDTKRIKNGEGVWEFRINHGPGYRIYFGKKGSIFIVLLAGGNKKSQKRDILKAKQYWLECKDLNYE